MKAWLCGSRLWLPLGSVRFDARWDLGIGSMQRYKVFTYNHAEDRTDIKFFFNSGPGCGAVSCAVQDCGEGLLRDTTRLVRARAGRDGCHGNMAAINRASPEASRLHGSRNLNHTRRHIRNVVRSLRSSR